MKGGGGERASIRHFCQISLPAAPLFFDGATWSSPGSKSFKGGGFPREVAGCVRRNGDEGLRAVLTDEAFFAKSDTHVERESERKRV
jgi:hypothetical protein